MISEEGETVTVVHYYVNFSVDKKYHILVSNQILHTGSQDGSILPWHGFSTKP